MPIDEDRLKSIRRERPARIPVSYHFLPATWMKYRERLDELLARHPESFPGHVVGARDYSAIGRSTYHAGEHVDAWGCVWSNVRDGMEAIVTGHPLPNREDINRLAAPERDDDLPHGFMFLRLTDLRGFEEAMIDFAEEPPELQRLIDIVRDYNIRQMENRVRRLGPAPEMVSVGDDLGIQQALPISPAKWRQYLKPAFAAIYAPAKRAGHYVYMHTDGCMWEIAGDLADCGVDIVNPQYRANGIAGLKKMAADPRLTLDVDLDRQLLPFATPKAIDEHLRELVGELANPAGGLWMRAEFSPDIPLENIDAALSAIARHRELS